MIPLERIRERAINDTDVHVVLPEGRDPRVARAAVEIERQKIARVTILGKEEELLRASSEAGVFLDNISIVDPEQDPDFESYVAEYYELRMKKGMTPDLAREIMQDPTFFSAMMLRMDRADICISGALNPTAHVLRAGLQIVRTAPGCTVMSSSMLMFAPDKRPPLSFADCAVNPDPTAEQLAEIAYTTAITHRSIFNEEPHVALLSFSTRGSACHILVDKVVQALEIARKAHPDLNIDGEMQADAAIVDTVGKKKAPGSKVAGRANVLIFPDLNAGNIGYKLVQRFGGYEAVGPILQGLSKPIHDLSRGCSVEDIINLAAVAALQSAK
ncbi:MAG: phosphate acetyltransferase [Candidatus Neomarinimicrobiota bacterium]|jgi:phosphate acetyltransferase|nr:phosphate acetyltransferase [Candidatus Neomarinimicrobiota bacterium]MDX9779880.1 phosphate acetyltransferase [bacterium]